MRFLNPEAYREFYAGLEIHFEGARFVFGIAELIQLAMDQVGYYHGGMSAAGGELGDRLNFIRDNLGGVDIAPKGNIAEWLAIAEQLKQKRVDEKPTVDFGFKIAGRRIVIPNPSDRYAHDYGSEERFAVDIREGKVSASSVVITEKGPDFDYYSDFKASDCLTNNKDYAGYRKLCSELMKARLFDNQLTHAVRHALLGLEPMRSETYAAARKEAKDSVEQLRLIKEKFERGEINQGQLEEALSKVTNIAALVLERQKNYSGILTHAMRYPVSFSPSSAEDAGDETKLAECISVLVAAWFLSEFSRNRSAYVSAKMLLDLIESEARMHCDGMPVIWRTVLAHPDLPLEGALNKVDPDRTLNKIGGLHPMVHLGSFSEGFTHDPFHLDPLRLEWAHVKTGAIMCEWLFCYLKQLKLEVRFLNREELFLHNSLPAALKPKLADFFLTDAQEVLETSFSQPSEAAWRMSADTSPLTVEEAQQYSATYRSLRNKLWLEIRKGFMNLCIDHKHPSLLKPEASSLPPLRMVPYFPIKAPDGAVLIAEHIDKGCSEISFTVRKATSDELRGFASKGLVPVAKNPFYLMAAAAAAMPSAPGPVDETKRSGEELGVRGHT